MSGIVRDHRKFCPMTFNRSDARPLLRCFEDDCAWWEEYSKRCVIKGIFRELIAIGEGVNDG